MMRERPFVDNQDPLDRGKRNRDKRGKKTRNYVEKSIHENSSISYSFPINRHAYPFAF